MMKKKQMQANMNDARIEWPDSGAWALIPNVTGWDSGLARWMMEAWWIDQIYDRVGDMNGIWDANLKQMQMQWDEVYTKNKIR